MKADLDWNGVRHFVALVEHETLTAAAEQLAVQHSTVSRQVAQLEKSLGLRLFDRIGKRYLLTDDGRRIHQHAQELVREMRSLVRVARVQTETRHTVTLSAPPLILRRLLMPHLPDFCRQHPGIQLQLQGEGGLADLHARQADMALRLVRPHQPDLVIRRLLQFRFRPYASRAYLDAHTQENWQFIQFQSSPASRWFASLIPDESAVLMSTNDLAAVQQAVAAGIGIGMLADFMVSATDDLVPLRLGSGATAGDDAFPVDLYLVMHEDVRQSPSVRAAADFWAERLGVGA